MANRDEYIIELREAVKQYNVSNKDIISMSEIRHEMEKIGFWKKEMKCFIRNS